MEFFFTAVMHTADLTGSFDSSTVLFLLLVLFFGPQSFITAKIFSSCDFFFLVNSSIFCIFLHFIYYVVQDGLSLLLCYHGPLLAPIQTAFEFDKMDKPTERVSISAVRLFVQEK